MPYNNGDKANAISIEGSEIKGNLVAAAAGNNPSPMNVKDAEVGGHAFLSTTGEGADKIATRKDAGTREQMLSQPVREPPCEHSVISEAPTKTPNSTHPSTPSISISQAQAGKNLSITTTIVDRSTRNIYNYSIDKLCIIGVILAAAAAALIPFLTKIKDIFNWNKLSIPIDSETNNNTNFFQVKKIFEERKISNGGKGLHTGIIYTLETLADGRLLSGSSDRTIKIWGKNKEGNYESQETLTAHHSIHAFAMLSNDCFISSVDDQNFYLWASQENTCSTAFTNTNSFSAPSMKDVYSLATFPNGIFISGSKKGEIGIWSPDNPPLGKRSYVLNQKSTSHNKTIHGLTILSQARFASSGNDGKIYLWLSENGIYKPKELGTHGKKTSALITLPDNQTLISGADDGTLKLWAPNSTNSNFYTLKQTFNENNPNKDESITQIIVVGYNSLVIATDRGNLALCKVNDTKKEYWCSNYQSAYVEEITALTALANKQWIATGTFRGRLNIWAVDFAKNRTPIFNKVEKAIGIENYHSGIIYALEALSDGSLISGSNDGFIKIWHEASPGIYKCSQTLSLRNKGNTTGITAIHAFNNNDFISSSSISNEFSKRPRQEFELWQRKINKCGRSYSLKKMFEGNNKLNIYAFTVLPNGRFVSGNNVGGIYLWSPTDKTSYSEKYKSEYLQTHEKKVNKIIPLSHNRFASSGNDGAIYLWLPKDGTYARKDIGSHYKTGSKYKNVTIAALSDNSTIISGSSDGTLKIWIPSKKDINSYSCTQTFNKHNSDNSNESINNIVAVAGDQLVAATDRGKLTFCKNIGTRNHKNYNCSHYYEAHKNDEITALTTLNNRQWIATGTARSDIKIWSINSSLTHQEDNSQSQGSANQTSPLCLLFAFGSPILLIFIFVLAFHYCRRNSNTEEENDRKTQLVQEPSVSKHHKTTYDQTPAINAAPFNPLFDQKNNANILADELPHLDNHPDDNQFEEGDVCLSY